MRSIYYPDHYRRRLISDKFKNGEDFVKTQIKYRREVEKWLKEIIDFNEMDRMLEEINTPIAEDKEYNFYHKFSTLGSNYLFLRNNYHVENLTSEQIQLIQSGQIDREFIKNTIGIVLYEPFNYTDKKTYNIYYEKIPVLTNSIIIEFAYDIRKCNDINQISNIEKVSGQLGKKIEEEISQATGENVSFLVYDFLPDAFYELKENEAIIL